jgi:hypothetical protein
MIRATKYCSVGSAFRPLPPSEKKSLLQFSGKEMLEMIGNWPNTCCSRRERRWLRGMTGSVGGRRRYESSWTATRRGVARSHGDALRLGHPGHLHLWRGSLRQHNMQMRASRHLNSPAWSTWWLESAECGFVPVIILFSCVPESGGLAEDGDGALNLGFNPHLWFVLGLRRCPSVLYCRGVAQL